MNENLAAIAIVVLVIGSLLIAGLEKFGVVG